MTTTKATEFLANVPLGAKINFRGSDYIVLKHNRANTQIKSMTVPASVFNLAGRAPVEVVSMPSLEEQMDVRYTRPAAKVGDTVRIPNGRFGGIVGIVSKITADKIHVVQIGNTGVISMSIHEELEQITTAEFANLIQ